MLRCAGIAFLPPPPAAGHLGSSLLARPRVATKDRLDLDSPRRELVGPVAHDTTGHPLMPTLTSPQCLLERTLRSVVTFALQYGARAGVKSND